MTVDKFGRPLFSDKNTPGERGVTGPRGPPGPSGPAGILPTDKDGHYIVQSKRLKSLHDPEDKQDAVTKQWVEKNFLAATQKTILSVGNRRLTDLAAPTQPNDAVTKAYLESRLAKEQAPAVTTNTGAAPQSTQSKSSKP